MQPSTNPPKKQFNKKISIFVAQTTNMSYSIIKEISGFSTCFRQWKAEGTHCKFLHGYAVRFRLYIEGTLDERNWVFSFGDFKDLKLYLEELFDHTVAMAEDDPFLTEFIDLDAKKAIRLKIFPKVGTEIFAEHVLKYMNNYLIEKKSPAKCVRVECWENEKNCGVYEIKS